MFGRDFYRSQKSITHNLNLEVVRGQSRSDIRPLSVSYHRYSKFRLLGNFGIYLSIYCYWLDQILIIMIGSANLEC